MKTYKCDVCKQPIAHGEGVLHDFNDLADSVNAEGFAIWPWDEYVITKWTIGKIHKGCIGPLVQKYLTRFGWGRLELPGAHVIITRKKMAARKNRA